MTNQYTYLFYSNDDEEGGNGAVADGDDGEPDNGDHNELKKSGKKEVTKVVMKPEAKVETKSKGEVETNTGEEDKVETKSEAKVETNSGEEVGDNNEGEKQIIIRRSKRIKARCEMDDFIVQDYKEKRRSFKSKQEESRRRKLAAPFILSESSVTFRAVAGQYGQFGEKDSMYDDQQDFDKDGDTSESTPKVKKTNVIHSDDDDDDDNDGLSIGDTTLRNNIQKNIEMLEDDDIDLEIFDKPLKQRTPTTRGRGRKRGRGRGHGNNIAEPKIGNDNEDNEEVVRFINGSFHNTELPIKKYEYDEDIFTAESSSSLEVVAEVHGEQTQPIIVDTATAPVNELNPVTNDDALIVLHQDKLYLVDPAPKPEQPVILVNKGGNLNGVFLNAKMEHDGIIYEVDEKKTSNKVGNNEVRNEPYQLINLNSGYTYKGSLSEEEEKVCSVKPLVVKEKGCRTDSELERFGVIKYKINSKDDTAVTKATEDGKKNETPPHDAPASVTKNDTPVTKPMDAEKNGAPAPVRSSPTATAPVNELKPTEPASVTKDDDSPVTTPTEPASVTKDDTPVTKPMDAEKNGAPAPVRSSPTATAPVNELNPG